MTEDGTGAEPDAEAAGGAEFGAEADGTEAEPDTGTADDSERGTGAGRRGSAETTSGLAGVPYTCPPLPARG